MSAFFGHTIKIDILMKNNFSIKTEIFWEDRDMGPLDDPGEVKDISSGKELLYAIASWSPVVGHEMYFGNGNRWDCKNEDAILALEDFSNVQKITIKDVTDFDDGYTTTQSLTISSRNNKYITKDGLPSKEELRKKRINIPDSVTKIWENAFTGCNNFTALVREGKYTERMLSKIGCGYYQLPLDYDVDEEKVERSEAPAQQGTTIYIKARFEDGKEYVYSCGYAVKPGDKVMVKGSKAGEPGVVVEIVPKNKVQAGGRYLQPVENAFNVTLTAKENKEDSTKGE